MKKKAGADRENAGALSEERDSVIISFGPGTSFFAVAADLFLQHPFLISERNDPAACPHPFLRNLVYRRAGRVIFQTEEAKDCFPKTLRDRGRVIPNPIAEGLPKPWDGEREKTVVAVGRLEAQKNYELLLEAFARFRRKFPDYTLHIYGMGTLLEELKEKARGLEIRIALSGRGFGRCPFGNPESRDLCLSSDYEGISNALLRRWP